MTEIIIECRGGVVQCVTANREDVRVGLLDWDEIESSNRDAHKIQWIAPQNMEQLDVEARQLYESGHAS